MTAIGTGNVVCEGPCGEVVAVTVTLSTKDATRTAARMIAKSAARKAAALAGWDVDPGGARCPSCRTTDTAIVA